VPTVGLIVNPVAGVGGPLAFRGSDDREAVAHALETGAAPVAAARARRALAVLRRALPGLGLLSAPGPMGADVAADAGFDPATLELEVATPTTAADTQAAAVELLRRDPSLLLFAGGDGTACDVLAVVGTDLPLLGIPSGVKMRSAVFATSPEAAGEAAARYLGNPGDHRLRDAEVVDEPEPGVMGEAVLHGIARVPDVAGQLQPGKSMSPRSDDAALGALCASIAAEMEPGRLYLLGPGTTTARILSALGLEGTLLGVDAVRDGALAGRDLDESAILDLLADDAPATLILGVIGGQGFLLGRGNQQLTPRVLHRIGPGNVEIVAGADKVLALAPPVLHVDIGGEEAERLLDGYRQVRVAPDRSVVLKVTS
jgi:predicted polyphosphate/ATP-dependent NAD kinase